MRTIGDILMQQDERDAPRAALHQAHRWGSATARCMLHHEAPQVVKVESIDQGVI